MTAVVNGVGAAGVAIMRLVKRAYPGLTLRAVDSKGIVSSSRSDINGVKQLSSSEGGDCG